MVVLGAAGGIGSFVLQLLKAAGASPIAVATSRNHPYVLGLGATEAIDYRETDVVEAIRAAHPAGVAAVFDLVGDPDQVGKVAALVRPGGHVVSMMSTADAESLAARKIIGVNVRTQATTQKLERLARAVTDGTLSRPSITALPLAEAGRALAECAARHVRGKLVLVP